MGANLESALGLYPNGVQFIDCLNTREVTAKDTSQTGTKAQQNISVAVSA